MQQNDLEKRFEEARRPLSEAVYEYSYAASRLCEVIRKSNGQLKRAIIGCDDPIYTSNGASALPAWLGRGKNEL